MKGSPAVAQMVLLGIALVMGGTVFAEPQYSLESAGIFSPLVKEPLNPKNSPCLFTENPPWAWTSLPKEWERPFLNEEAVSEEAWRPLSEAEIRQREKELAELAVKMSAELADSLFLSRFSESILWTTERFSATQRRLAEQYRLHLNLSDDNATLTYNITY